ncbi:MAG: LptF/LptG family permease [Pirellulales bacterium]|nr:LptF/LptG family permease [Pirellulales bacterium]
MKILTRYILSEFLQTLAVSLLAMTLFMIVVGLLREAQLQGLGLKQILLLVPYILPEALRFAVPATVLFAACVVYGRLAASNEVIAVKAAGITPWVFFAPALMCAVLLSFWTVWLNDLAVSWGREGIRRVVMESVEEIAYAKLTQQRSFTTKGFSINVQRVEGKRLINPTLTFQANLDSPAYTLNATEAEIRANPAENTLTLICRDSDYEFGSTKGRIPGLIERVVPLDESTRKGGGGGSPSDLPMSKIPAEIELQQTKVAETESQLAAVASLALVTGDFGSLAESAWQPKRQQLAEARGKIARLQMESQRRWANGFSCLCFVAVGAPLSVMFRRADFITNFFICFLPVIVVYYPLLIVAVDSAKSGSIPSVAVWLGNGILLAIGWWLYKRVRRY